MMMSDLLNLLRGDITAMCNRLQTADNWRRLTDAQRDSLEDVRRRGALALGRIDAATAPPPPPDAPPVVVPPPDPPARPVPTVANPYPEHPLWRPIPRDAREWAGRGAVVLPAGIHLDTGAESPGVFGAGPGDPEWTAVLPYPTREFRLRAPLTIAAGTGSDRALCVIDPERGFEWRFWLAEIDHQARRITCANGNQIELGTHRILHGGRCTGWGWSYTAGTVRPEEIAAGVIGHALRISATYIGAAHVAPAQHSDQRGECPPRVPMGVRIYLPRELDAGPVAERISARLTDPLNRRAGLVMLEALRSHGMTPADGGGFPTTVYLEGRQSAEWRAVMGPPTGSHNGHETWNGIGRALSEALPWDQLRITDDPRLGEWLG